jgi:DNA-binding transcriptional LysR family regulator
MRRAYTPTLPELEAFTHAARTGSATAAAASLGLTQSAVSRSLATLEARLGVALFHRVKKRLILSDAGRAFLRNAERLLSDLDASALAVMAHGGHRDVIRIACLPTFGAVWLMPKLAAFARSAPEVTFDMTATLAPVDFDRDPFDIAIGRLPRRPGLSHRVLLRERLVVVAAPDLMGGQGMLEDAALAQLPLLQQATRPNLWLDWFLDAGLDPIRILRGARFEQFGMVIAAAKAGMGVALVPDVLVAEDRARGDLRLASARYMVTPTPYAMTWPDRADAPPALSRFRDWLAP